MAFQKLSQHTIDLVKNADLLTLASALGHTYKRTGSTFQMYCPNPHHHERTPDTHFKPAYNRFKCFGGGGCGAGGDIIAYYAWAKQGGYDTKMFYIYVEEIAQILNIPVEYEESNKKGVQRKSTGHHNSLADRSLSDSNSTVFRKNRPEPVQARDADDCDRVYRKFLDACPIYRGHAEEWMGPKRQFTIDDIRHLNLRSVPNSYREIDATITHLIKSGESLERIPGFTQRLKKGGNPENEADWYWTIAVRLEKEGLSGYFIPVHDEVGRIIRLRVATTDPKRKYIWFSSTPNVYKDKESNTWKFDAPDYEKEKEKNLHRMRKGGAPSGAPINVVIPTTMFPLWKVGTPIYEVISTSVLIGTEGEFKSQISANKLNALVTGVPGVGNYRDVLPFIKKAGIKKFILAYDMDSLSKKDSISGKNEEVFKHLVNFAKEVIKISFDIEVVIWTWNVNHGKGLDDLLLAKRLPVEIDLFTGERRPVKLEEMRNLLKPAPKRQPVQTQTMVTTCETPEPPKQMEKTPAAEPVQQKTIKQPEAEKKKSNGKVFDFSCFAADSDAKEEERETEQAFI
ncbi:CHC2 zinc finger domain-containing protein [Aneurinibacillus migulanus]|uniref:CHC2 zinc finger domain-containing protein n=1 Tax=Aneurinibacillus migulanus TaxID=47500 RepID=UPI002E1A566B|nr:CHC2 zinc finger domain-containing protein [Aneurinibacillus migulanus]MED4728603.1 CHC2 zinc finger domain-containing protein [Aneurinibacillus migulanus]